MPILNQEYFIDYWINENITTCGKVKSSNNNNTNEEYSEYVSQSINSTELLITKINQKIIYSIQEPININKIYISSNRYNKINSQFENTKNKFNYSNIELNSRSSYIKKYNKIQYKN